MAFDNGVLQEVQDIAEGEVIENSPHNIDNFEKFEDGLKIGLIAKLDNGQVDNLDGSATPVIIGVPKRKINKALSSDTYVSTGDITDRNADVCTFGRITVLATSVAVPVEGNQVYVINAVANADNGKVTQDSGETGALIVPNASFKEVKRTGVWVITFKQYTV